MTTEFVLQGELYSKDLNNNILLLINKNQKLLPILERFINKEIKKLEKERKKYEIMYKKFWKMWDYEQSIKNLLRKNNPKIKKEYTSFYRKNHKLYTNLLSRLKEIDNNNNNNLDWVITTQYKNELGNFYDTKILTPKIIDLANKTDKKTTNYWKKVEKQLEKNNLQVKKSLDDINSKTKELLNRKI